MVATIENMAKKQGKRTAPVRVSAEIARMIELIATAEGLTAAEICDPILAGPVRERMQRAMVELGKEQKELTKFTIREKDQ